MRNSPQGCRPLASRLRRAAGVALNAAILASLVTLSAPVAARSSDDTGGSQQTLEQTIRVGDQERDYRLYVPASARGRPVPLLVAIHPALGDGDSMEKLTRFDALADANNFIVAYPTGISKVWNAGSCCGAAMKKNVDDIGFIDAMVAQIKSSYQIDSTRQYAAGFSNGAFLVHHIACLEPNDFAAYAVVGGAITTPNCRDATPTPILVIHGTKDPRSPWNGGTTEGVYRPPVPDLMQRLAKRNHCASTEKTTFSSGAAVCQSFDGCGDNETMLCAMQGVGHQWPGGRSYMPLFLGPNTQDFDASAQMWQFFQRHHH